MTFTIIGIFAGGLGLFMLGLRLMTDGLKYASGQSLKTTLLRKASRGDISVRQMVNSLDLLSRLRRIGERTEKSARYMDTLHLTEKELQPGDTDTEEDIPDDVSDQTTTQSILS